MPNRGIEQQLERLSLLRESAPDEAMLAALRKALNDRTNLVVAKAASVAESLALRSLVPDLLAAFDRLFENPAKTDPQCWGKNALSKALKNLEYSESRPFLLGLQHVQMEPVWGTRVDTAITLRGTSALALVSCSDLPREEKLRNLVRALTDRETPVRIDAVRALESMEGIESALLLRLKIQTGDREAAVTGQALESLLNLEGEAGVSFVSGFLMASSEEIREEAALALGASRLPGALAVLIEAWKNPLRASLREAILRAAGASRQQPAIEFLIGIVRESPPADALAALKALEFAGGSAELQKRIEEAVAGRPEPAIWEYFEAHLKE